MLRFLCFSFLLSLPQLSFSAIERNFDGSCEEGLAPLHDQCVSVPEFRDAHFCHATLILRFWSEHHSQHDARDACTLAAKSWGVNDYETDCSLRYDKERKRWTSLWWYPYQNYEGLTVKGVGNKISDDIAPLMSKKYYYETEVRYTNCGKRTTF